jgi:hypothetical protein
MDFLVVSITMMDKDNSVTSSPRAPRQKSLIQREIRQGARKLPSEALSQVR